MDPHQPAPASTRIHISAILTILRKFQLPEFSKPIFPNFPKTFLFYVSFIKPFFKRRASLYPAVSHYRASAQPQLQKNGEFLTFLPHLPRCPAPSQISMSKSFLFSAMNLIKFCVCSLVKNSHFNFFARPSGMIRLILQWLAPELKTTSLNSSSCPIFF